MLESSEERKHIFSFHSCAWYDRYWRRYSICISISNGLSLMNELLDLILSVMVFAAAAKITVLCVYLHER